MSAPNRLTSMVPTDSKRPICSRCKKSGKLQIRQDGKGYECIGGCKK